MNNYNKQTGFNLIELMVTVAIVAVLASVALPSYRNYVIKTNRSEGTSDLVKIMDRQERYYANQFPPTYTTDLATIGYGDYENDNYVFSAVTCLDGSVIGRCVRLIATPKASQDVDGILTLNSLGQQTRDGNDGGWTD